MGWYPANTELIKYSEELHHGSTDNNPSWHHHQYVCGGVRLLTTRLLPAP
jgi:hypothetical protein